MCWPKISAINTKFDLRWVHNMTRQELILRLNAGIWLTTIFKPHPDPRKCYTKQKTPQHHSSNTFHLRYYFQICWSEAELVALDSYVLFQILMQEQFILNIHEWHQPGWIGALLLQSGSIAQTCVCIFLVLVILSENTSLEFIHTH